MKKGSKLIVHWSGNLQDGMAYVMLSRCERLQDIYIVGDFAKSGIKCNSYAIVETEELDKAFDQRMSKEEEDWNTSLSVSYLNVRSIESMDGHIVEVAKETLLTKSNIFALGETWLSEGEERKVEGFHDTYQSNGKGKGIAVYSKEHQANVQRFSSKLASAMMVDEEKLKTIFLYLSKGFDWNELQFVLSCWISSSKPTIIIGDMNWHFPKNHQMKTYLSKRGFTQLIQRATHQEGHIIDHLYVSTCLQEQFSYKVIQNSVHFSDHDIIGIQLFEKETSIVKPE